MSYTIVCGSLIPYTYVPWWLTAGHPESRVIEWLDVRVLLQHIQHCCFFSHFRVDELLVCLSHGYFSTPIGRWRENHPDLDASASGARRFLNLTLDWLRLR